MKTNFVVNEDSLNCFKNWLIKNHHKPNEYILFSLNDNNVITPYGLTEKGIKMYERYGNV